MTTEAGQGEHHIYFINSTGQPIEAHKHYLGVDAVSWFLNKEGSFFTDRSASGTVEISLVDDKEKYSIALGAFELDDGARIAPVFNKPLLPDRQFRGGAMTLKVALVSYKRDTLPASLLKGAADASLNIVAGMVQTATAAGPQQILTVAGSELISGVRTALKSARKQEEVFSGGGISTGLRAANLLGENTYVLMHRGAELDEGMLQLGKRGAVVVPLYDGAYLEDGAWILLRFRRSSTYSSERPWSELVRGLRTDISDLASDVADGVRDRAEGIRQLAPSPNGGTETLFDTYAALRRTIQSDGVLTEDEARKIVRELALLIQGARQSMKEAGDSHGDLPVWETLGTSGHTGDLVAAEIAAFDAYRGAVAPRVSSEPDAWVPEVQILPNW